MVDEQKLRQLADQLICHPVSRSLEEIESAGEAIMSLLDELQTMRAAVKQARIDALEEAKQLFPQPHCEHFGRDIQDAIESLKETP